MEDSSKEALMEEAPPRYTESPRLPCIPHELKSLLLMVALVVVALVVVNVTFLLLGLHLSESHAETVLRMSIHGLDGQGTAQELAMSKKERSGTFAVRDGLNGSAAVVYDYSKLLVGYRSWRHRACYITRVDKDNFPGLDAVTETFQRRQDEDVGDKAVPLADRSILGTTINILCSAVPVFWAYSVPPVWRMKEQPLHFQPSRKSSQPCPLLVQGGLEGFQLQEGLVDGQNQGPAVSPCHLRGTCQSCDPLSPKKVHAVGTSASPKSHQQWCPRSRNEGQGHSPRHGDPVPTLSPWITGNLSCPVCFPCHIKQLQVPKLAKGHEPALTLGTATAGCSTLEGLLWPCHLAPGQQRSPRAWGQGSLTQCPRSLLSCWFPGGSSWEWVLSKHQWSGSHARAWLHPGATKPFKGSPPQCPSIKFPVPAVRLGWEWEEEEEEEAAAMESSMKQVVLEEEDSGNGCCCPGCCVPCATCCAKCCTKCSWCCAKCCCLPKCCECPKCPKCPSCPKCPGCASCSGCLKKSLCFVPRLLCYLPRKLLSCGRLRCLLIVVVVLVLLVLIIAGALLMWLSVEQRRADTVLRGGLWAAPAWEEDAATFYLDSGDGNPATVIYDYKNLLVSYRARLHRACYVTRVDKDNIPGLDTVVETFQRRQNVPCTPAQAEDEISVPLADRSLLGTTAGILCSLLPVYWA
ncbi:pulmonary surfactant-associated protein C [Serinus canaria]|uniref:pulmonary surfactant-associated protein C n=1 Tax=Serinus canaria TaxID=9135 RepID=UPI0021CCB8B3|nr:pulmonary surfactant-associated protein C [Serinus canaria]